MSQYRALADTREGQLTTALILIASLALPLGLTLPSLETVHFAFWSDVHSIGGLTFALFSDGEYLLSALVALFSIAFPVTKLALLWRIQFRRGPPLSARALRRLEFLGKWSMADVLVVALIVFSLRDSLVFGATPQIGVFVFAASTLMAMLASGRISRQCHDRLERRQSPSRDAA